MSFLPKLGQKFDKVMGKEQDFLEAARNGDVQTIDKLLSNRLRQSMGGVHRLTSILHSPVNVNCTDRNGYTPLHHATVNGHREVVEKLLKAEAQPGVTDHQGCTPCHLAAWHGDAEICLQLLNAGTENVGEGETEIVPVQVNQQNLSGDTALHCASQYGHIAVVDVLLQKHANPNIRNLQEESPLDLAAMYGKKEVVQLLLIQFPDLVTRPLCKHSPLHLASRNGHKDVVAVLLDAGFHINTLTETRTALHEAALYGKLDVVKLLLERRINVLEKDQNGYTALDLIDDHKSKQKAYAEIKNAIIEHMDKLKQASTDAGDYDTLSSTATVASSKESPKSKKSPVPKPRPGTFVIESPTEETPKDGYGYSKPQKEKLEDIDRVTSSTSSEAASPPPIPPRTSIFPAEDKVPVIVEPKEPPVQSASSSESNSPQLGIKPTAVPRPKKPPRQKKSPLPARRLSEESESPTSSPTTHSSGNQSSGSPPPRLPPKPTSPKLPPKPASVRKPPAIPSAMSDSTNEIKENHLDQSHSKDDKQDQSDSVIDGAKSVQSHSCTDSTKTDQSDITSTKVDQPQPIYSEIDQSNKSPTETDQSRSDKFELQQSPPPDLPPRPCVTGAENPSDLSQTKTLELIDPVFGTPVKQNVYMEMKPAEKKEQTEEIYKMKPLKQLKPAEINTDSYGMLFPKFKSTKGSSLQPSSEKAKRPELKRTNTSPDENIYVGPSSPESTLAKFKEKQGLLRRANTTPDENAYITVTEKILKRQEKVESENRQEKVETENLYSEIAEQKSPTTPQSPTENVYASIPDRTSDLYESLANATSGVKGVNALKTEKNDTDQVVPKGDVVESRTNRDQEASEQSDKPNYLDFVARKSLAQGPLTPTGYAQPPTPDFPPPSPATAMQGIELKIQEMDDVVYV